MKQKIFIFTLLYLSLTLPASTVAADDTPTLALSGGTLVDGYGGIPVQNAVVLVSGDRIMKVGDVNSVDIPDGVKTIDANGMTVLPGLWESHGHLYHIGEGDPATFPDKFRSQVDSIIAAVARTTLMAGITTFRDTGGPIHAQLALRADIEAGRLPGPRLFLAGPVLHQRNPVITATSNIEYLIGSPAEAREVTEKVISLGVDQIKVARFWDFDILKAIVDTAHKASLGVEADVRHMNAYRTAIEAGVDRLHHVFTADPLSDYSAEDIRFLVRGIKPPPAGPMANILRGPYIIPTVEMRQAYVRVFAFPEFVDHPRFREQYSPDVYAHLRASWKNPNAVPWGIGAPERIKVAKRKLRNFIASGGREQIVAGTDAGSPFNMHSALTKEMQHYVEAGLTPMEVIQSATLRPAQMQGVEKDLGTVTEGKFADMIIVDGDPLQDITLLQHKIVLIIKGGKEYIPE
ncbi:MAG: amidohydrolase family protein [Gammaproteobacteria bacterium]|nr:amidohydrolase family protein [Gammaproteobacteria bacterium]